MGKESKDSMLVAVVGSKVEEVVKAIVKDELLEVLQVVLNFERVTTASIANLKYQVNGVVETASKTSKNMDVLKDEMGGLSKLMGRMLKNEGSEVEKSKKDLHLERIASLEKALNNLCESMDRMKDETSQLSKRLKDGYTKTTYPDDTVTERNVPLDTPKLEQESMPVTVTIPPATKTDGEKCEMVIKKNFKDCRKTSVFSGEEKKEEKSEEIVEQEEYNGNTENFPFSILSNKKEKHIPTRDIQKDSDEIGTDDQSLRTKASKLSMQLAEIIECGERGSISEKISQFEDLAKPDEPPMLRKLKSAQKLRASFAANVGQVAAVTALREAAAILGEKPHDDDKLRKQGSCNLHDDISSSEGCDSCVTMELDARTSRKRETSASIKIASLLLMATKMTNHDRTHHDKYTPKRQGSGLSTPGQTSCVSSILTEVSMTVNELMRIQNVQNRGDDDTSANDSDLTTAPLIQSKGSMKSLNIESILGDMI